MTTATVARKRERAERASDDEAVAEAEGVEPATRVDRPLEKRVDHVSAEKAAAKGKAARLALPRSVHAVWDPPPGRLSPVDIIAEQATSREPDLVPIRHGRMMVTPFTFYRGAAAIMAADLAATPVSGLRAQLCGDAHLLNFGGFASPERALLFDVNDFDETLPGPWEWDVKRLAASIEVAGRDGGLKPADRRAAVEATVRQYREVIRALADQTELGVWYSRLEGEALVALVRAQVGPKEAPNLEATLAKARSKDSMKAFSKLTTVVNGEARITPDPPLIVPMRDLLNEEQSQRYEHEIHQLFRAYRRTLQPDRRHLLEQYRIVDIARKVVGVGSVGTRCWVLLLMGRRDADPRLPAGQRGPGLGARPLRRQEQGLQPGPAGGRGPAGHAGGERHLLGLAEDHRHGQPPARLLHPPALGREGLGRPGEHDAGHPGRLRPHLWLDPGPGARPLGRPHSHRRLPRGRNDVRPGHR